MPLIVKLFLYGGGFLYLTGAVYLIQVAVNLAASQGRRVTFPELLLGLMSGYISLVIFLFMLLQDVAGWPHSKVSNLLEFLFLPLLIASGWLVWQFRHEKQD